MAGQQETVDRAAQLAAFAREAGILLSVTPELETAVSEFIRRAHSAWPDLHVSDDVLLRHVGSRLGDGDAVSALESLHAGDLYLACGCSLGDPRAISIFEREFVSQVATYLSRQDSLVGFTNEVKQAVRERILVATDTLLPRIHSYTGRGPLGGWLRIVTTRIASDLRRGQKQTGRRYEPAPLPSNQPDPELAYLKQRYGREFEQALEESFAKLSAQQSNLLRLHFVDGLAASAMAPMYAVSGRTIQRWIAAAQNEVLVGMRRILSERLKLSPRELDSMLGLVQSQLNISLRRFVAMSPRE
jgi:RNA polymerase sigma-70 factor (ECF subfamily)